MQLSSAIQFRLKDLFDTLFTINPNYLFPGIQFWVKICASGLNKDRSSVEQVKRGAGTLLPARLTSFFPHLCRSGEL